MDEELDENDNELYNLEHNIYEKKEDSNYDIWFKKQKDSNLFISENYENILSNGSGEYIKIIKNNLKRYLETIGNNRSNIVKYLTENIAKINFKQINNNVIKILSERYYGHEEKDEVLYKSIEYCNFLSSKYKELDDIYDINNLTDITRAKCYISVKMIILPFNTEQLLGDKLELIFDSNQDNILKYKQIGKQIHYKVIKTLQLSIMPTFEENQDFINKMREEFKNKRLELYDKLNEEQRKVFNELSKIGVKIENAIDDVEIELNEEEPEYDGENEFVMNGNNDEQHHDDLDNDDYGHIYDD